jgi:hypothetical protein
MREIEEFSKEELLGLLGDAAKNWLAHDGLWFQEVEKHFGIQEAIRLDQKTWERFSVVEAQRIMKRLGISPGGGIPALIWALKFRLYAHINRQEIVEVSENRCVFRMLSCRVQEARKRQGLEEFPCKSVGLVEYKYFAKTIDPKIEVRCLYCPPDPRPQGLWCAWEFNLTR